MTIRIVLKTTEIVYELQWKLSLDYQTVTFATVATLAALKLWQQHLHE
jgi:hypothetical protein